MTGGVRVEDEGSGDMTGDMTGDAYLVEEASRMRRRLVGQHRIEDRSEPRRILKRVAGEETVDHLDPLSTLY